MKRLITGILSMLVGVALSGIPGLAMAGLVVKEKYEVSDPYGVIEEVLIGNQGTHVYHYSWCALANKNEPGKYDMFNTVQHAKQDGYKPCDVCRPPSRLGF